MCLKIELWLHKCQKNHLNLITYSCCIYVYSFIHSQNIVLIRNKHFTVKVWCKFYHSCSMLKILLIVTHSLCLIWQAFPITHFDIITFRLGSSLLRSTFVFTRHFGAKTISSRSHFEDDSSPHISGSGSSIWIDLTFVLFKHVILRWINYLETWLHSDNTSYYYTNLVYCLFRFSFLG